MNLATIAQQDKADERKRKRKEARRAKRHKEAGERFTIRWRDADGNRQETVYRGEWYRSTFDATPRQIREAAWQLGLPEGTSFECRCNWTATHIFGTAQRPAEEAGP